MLEPRARRHAYGTRASSSAAALALHAFVVVACGGKPADCARVCELYATCNDTLVVEVPGAPGESRAPVAGEHAARRSFCEEACRASSRLQKALGSCEESDCFAQVLCVTDAMVEEPSLNSVPQSCALPAEAMCEQYGLPAAIMDTRPTCALRGGSWKKGACARENVYARCVGEADSVVVLYMNGAKVWTPETAQHACVMGRLTLSAAAKAAPAAASASTGAPAESAPAP